MRNLSSKWKKKVNSGMDVQYIKYADITLTDGTTLNLTSADLWQNGMTFEDSVSSDSSFDIGSAIINVLNLSINNFDGEYSDYDFEGAEVICYVGLQLEDEDTSELLDSAGEQILDSTGDTIIVHKNAVIEKIRICTATVVEQPEDETVTIDLTCEDNMRKFDRDYSDSKLEYPATRGQIIRDACEVCGVTLQTYHFDHDDYIVQIRPSDDALTFRQVLQWVAQIGCQWLRCDEYGRLCVKWYDTEKTDAQEINTTYSFTPQHTDVVITGIQVTEYSDSSDEETESYMAGTQGYVLAISDNKLIRKGDGQTVASMIAEKCVGMIFRPFESECPTDVALEAGDAITIEDRNGNLYNTYLTTTTLQPGAGQNIACNAKSAAKNSSTRYNQITQVYVTARKMVKAEKTAREKALEEFGKRIDSATGVYTTVELQEDGSKIFYLHDKPTLAESQAVWKMTSEAWGVSTDGGQTWNGGMTVDGDTIVRILNAVGVNADWINAGAITVRDANGNILFQVDMDTKKVIISGTTVLIGGKTADKALSDNLQESKDYSDGKLADYADTVTGSLAGLQAQIDGQIESFFYDYEPSLQNEPAAEWTTTEERKKHEGDLFYWKSTGYAYRFMQDGAVWKWQMIQDNDISKALAQAEKAQDTADGKRRTFVAQPSPPYDIGDLWSQEGGDILTCVVSRAKGSVYASSDWKKLNKYTDDSTANKALEAASLARNMTLQLSNDMQTITSDADGNIPVFPTVATAATVMYGTQDITDDCSFTITKSANVTGSWNDETHVYNVTALSADNGWVDIKATYLDNLAVTKRFTISKQKTGKTGNTGKGIKGTPKSQYQVSASGTTAPTGTWLDSVPETKEGQFLWTKTVTEYTDGTSTTGYSVSYIGKNGTNGNGVVSTEVTYQASNNGTTPPTGEWNTTPPSAKEGQYIWTRVVTNYSKSDPVTSYSVGKIGENGKQLYTWRKYASMPDGSDMTDSPDYVKLLDSTGSPILDSTGVEIYTVTEAIYVGIADNKTTETPSDNPSDYIWSRFRGEDGADGIGIPGENGETSYIHTAYANSIDGTVDFSTTDTDRIYIGHYSDFKKVDSTDPKKYTWARMRGEDGVPGRTYMIEPSCSILKRGADKVISPNFLEFKAYYMDGNEAERHPYSGRFVIEETSDGETWTTIYTSSTDENTVKHYLYSILTDGSGQTVTDGNGTTVGIPRDVTNIRCRLYQAGGTVNQYDMQSVAVVIDVDNLTQEQIVEILYNDGEFKGLYYKDNHLYISFDAAMGGTLVLGGKNNGNGILKMRDKNGKVISESSNGGQILYDSNEIPSAIIQHNKIFFFDTPTEITSTSKDVTGTMYYAGGIGRFYGTVSKNDSGLIFFSSPVEFEGDEGAYNPPLWISRNSDLMNGDFDVLYVKSLTASSGTFSESPTISKMNSVSGAKAVGWSNQELVLISSSSKRYKDIGNNISDAELENWYGIQPVWAKYKDGYLIHGDENEGRYIPMFVAEDVEKCLPEAVIHDNGQVEDWNYRVMIPAMFAMLKQQKAEIDSLKQELDEIKQLLRKE